MAWSNQRQIPHGSLNSTAWVVGLIQGGKTAWSHQRQIPHETLE